MTACIRTHSHNTQHKTINYRGDHYRRFQTKEILWGEGKIWQCSNNRAVIENGSLQFL